MNVPESVAIILDGNGRWAKAKGMPRTYGHYQGAKIVEDICKAAWEMGIKYLTFFTFSTENWKRPKEEVEILIKLLRDYLVTCVDVANRNNMRVKVIGQKSRLAQDVIDRIAELEEATKNNTGLFMTIALNYGGRDEITRAAREVAKKVQSGEMSVDDITEESFAMHLDTYGIPDPDLLIRTCGEKRLSNFLLWQVSYTEFYATEVPWPDFTPRDLELACEEFANRNRRFGKVKP